MKNSVLNMLPANTIDNVHDRTEVDAVDLSNSANKSMVAVVASGQLFVCIHVANLAHLRFIQLGVWVVGTNQMMGDRNGLAGHGISTFFEGRFDGSFSYAGKQTIDWCGNLNDFTLAMSGENQLIVLDVDGGLVLGGNCEGLDGLESEVGHGWMGVLNSVSVAPDLYQTTPYAVKLCNRIDEDLLPAGFRKVL